MKRVPSWLRADTSTRTHQKSRPKYLPEADAKRGSVYDQDVCERSGGNHGLLLSLHGAFLDLGKVQAFIKTFSYSDNQSTGGVATPLFCLLPVIYGVCLHSY